MYESLKTKIVLYVEDEIMVLNNISELLQNYFKVFHTASDGEMAYTLFLEHEIDILIVDIELPKMNGIELITKIRESNKDIEIIVISAYTKTDYFLECINCQVSKYIVKPFTSRKIKELLELLQKDFESLVDTKTICLDEEFTFNIESSQLFQNNNLVNLTKKERELLVLLIENINSLISIDTMEYAIWPEQGSSPSRRRALISRLRAKLKHRFIETHASEGYIFRIENGNGNVCRA